MTLWIAWSALISAFIAIAAAALARAGAYLRAPRRFVWMGAMIASTVTPLSLAFRTGPAITASSPSQSRNATASLSTDRIASGDTVGSDRITIANAQSVAHVAVDSPIASSGSESGGVGRWVRWRHGLTTDIANVQLADSWIARAWALTSLILLLAFVRASVVLGRQRSRWRDVETDVAHVLVARYAGPAVVGFIHPRIVIPEWALSIERATRDLLLHHELEHVRAGDSRALLGAEMLLICAPWNAALWWMARQLRLAIEIDCDARVISSGGRTREYALVLLAVGERYASAIPLATSLSEPRSNLEARIDAMTAPRVRRPVVASLPFVGLAVAVLATSAWVPRPMPLLTSRARVPSEPVARPIVVESQSVGDTRSRVMDSSISTAISVTRSIATASVEGQRATDAQLNAMPTSGLVGSATAETSAAQPVQGNPAPRYPESLRDAHIEGAVLVAFSTDARGVPDTTTIKIVASTNDLFTTEVRNVLPAWRLVANDSMRLAFRFLMEQSEPHFRYGSIVPAPHSTMGTGVDYLLTNRTPKPFVFEGLNFVPVLITGVVSSARQQREPTWRPSWSFLRDLGHPLARLDPKPLPGNPAPRYPDALRANGTEGQVLLTFSTDARGVPDTTTINVIESTNDQFTNAIRRVLPNWRYDSAGHARFACRFMTLETEQKEAAAGKSPTFTIEGVAVVPVVVVSATPANTKPPLDVPQPIGIEAAGLSPARHEFETRAELEAQATAAEEAHRTGEAWLLRSRLEKGDFQEGDPILVVLEGANIVTKPETLVVKNGKNGKHLELPRMADLSLEGVLRAELQERLKQHLALYIREPVVRATPLVPERDHRDQQILSKPLSATVDTIAARIASLEVQRLAWLAGEPTSGAPQNDVEVQIRSLREQLRRLPERDSANRIVEARVAAALDARESELKGRLQQLRLVYTDNYPVVKDVARAERLVEERKAELRRRNP